MARRHERDEQPVLTQEELKSLQQRLATSSVLDVEAFYRSAHRACTLQPAWLPSPRTIQELVQAWKMLRKRRRNRRV